MSGQVGTPMRADARDNRERILATARVVFAADGLDVPIREIARRAQVGVATLYRHFPTKEALLANVLEERMALCSAIVQEGLATVDPWQGFCHVIEELMRVHALDRGFSRAFTAPPPEVVPYLAADRDRTLRAMGELIRRAKKSGDLREDLLLEDVILVLMANNGIDADSPGQRAAASRRFAALMIQSFRADSGPAALPPAVRLPIRLSRR